MKKDSIMYDGMTDSSRPGKIYGSRNQSKSNQNRKLVDTFPKSEVSPSGTFSEKKLTNMSLTQEIIMRGVIKTLNKLANIGTLPLDEQINRVNTKLEPMKTDEPEKEIIEITMDQSESSDSTPSQANTKNPKKKKSRKSKKQKQQPKDNTPAKKGNDK
ncbi:hypothetical protein RCL_jg25546.t2 [Rhizophagus clarus]|uniref:Uncharacterized protein n=1 Tax=Rhizophagus clarus TaxID=94130 RepID=A0A8H3LMS7_9GLOM|nr:hypothetical protein RCL_jg25546.t2 [Rhizophagus clarus]